MILTMNAMTFIENSPRNTVDPGETPNQKQTGILTAEANAFLLKLAGRFEGRRQELLARRRRVQQEIDNGKFPDFLPETAGIRRRRLESGADSPRLARPTRGNYRAGRSQDDH